MAEHGSEVFFDILQQRRNLFAEFLPGFIRQGFALPHVLVLRDGKGVLDPGIEERGLERVKFPAHAFVEIDAMLVEIVAELLSRGHHRGGFLILTGLVLGSGACHFCHGIPQGDDSLVQFCDDLSLLVLKLRDAAFRIGRAAAQFGPQPLHRHYTFHLKLLFVNFKLRRKDMAEDDPSKVGEQGCDRDRSKKEPAESDKEIPRSHGERLGRRREGVKSRE